jgi:hypothetical protein
MFISIRREDVFSGVFMAVSENEICEHRDMSKEEGACKSRSLWGGIVAFLTSLVG